MEYTKEHEFIVAKENGKLKGKLNLLTGELLGAKDAPVKNRPPCFTNTALRGIQITNGRVIHSQPIGFWQEVAYVYLDTFGPYTADYRHKAGNFERLVSLGIMVEGRHSTSWYSDVDNYTLNKEFIELYTQYCNEQHHVTNIGGNLYPLWDYAIADSTAASLRYHVELEKLDTKHEKEIYKELRKRYNEQRLPDKFVIPALKRMTSEHMIGYNHQSWSDLSLGDSTLMHILVQYYDWANVIFDEVKVTPHFLSNYVELRHLYELKKDELMDKKVQQFNSCPNLLFEDDEYFVKLLDSAAAFHDEAEAQGNCVERLYLEYVAQGHTRVVSIRSKKAPDKSLITCEVTLTGHIEQYLKRYNEHVAADSPEGRFKLKYQQHLNECKWG